LMFQQGREHLRGSVRQRQSRKVIRIPNGNASGERFRSRAQ
jgi:hypothetical protein